MFSICAVLIFVRHGEVKRGCEYGFNIRSLISHTLFNKPEPSEFHREGGRTILSELFQKPSGQRRYFFVQAKTIVILSKDLRDGTVEK
jgi:hypothetical protein